MMVTNDSSGVRHVEVMTNAFEEGDEVNDAWFLDDAIAPSATGSTTRALKMGFIASCERSLRDWPQSPPKGQAAPRRARGNTPRAQAVGK